MYNLNIDDIVVSSDITSFGIGSELLYDLTNEIMFQRWNDKIGWVGIPRKKHEENGIVRISSCKLPDLNQIDDHIRIENKEDQNKLNLKLNQFISCDDGATEFFGWWNLHSDPVSFVCYEGKFDALNHPWIWASMKGRSNRWIPVELRGDKIHGIKCLDIKCFSYLQSFRK